MVFRPTHITATVKYEANALYDMRVFTHRALGMADDTLRQATASVTNVDSWPRSDKSGRVPSKSRWKIYNLDKISPDGTRLAWKWRLLSFIMFERKDRSEKRNLKSTL